MRIYNLDKIIKNIKKNGLSIREASNKYNVTRSRLYNQVKKEMLLDETLNKELTEIFKNNQKRKNK